MNHAPIDGNTLLLVTFIIDGHVLPPVSGIEKKVMLNGISAEVLNKKYLSIQQQAVCPGNFSKMLVHRFEKNSISFNYLSAVNLEDCC